MKKKLISGIAAVALIVITLSVFKTIAHLREQQIDSRVIRDVERVLIDQLTNRPDAAITARYGAFGYMKESRWLVPADAWQLVQRLDYNATLEFEKADVQLSLIITKGPEPGIVKLNITPDATWERKVLASGGTLQLVSNEFWLIQGPGTNETRCVINGRAVHPDFKQ